MKHIVVRYHFVNEFFEQKIVEIEQVSSQNHLIDIFSKAFDFNIFLNLQKTNGNS